MPATYKFPTKIVGKPGARCLYPTKFVGYNGVTHPYQQRLLEKVGLPFYTNKNCWRNLGEASIPTKFVGKPEVRQLYQQSLLRKKGLSVWIIFSGSFAEIPEKVEIAFNQPGAYVINNFAVIVMGKIVSVSQHCHPSVIGNQPALKCLP